MEMIKGSIALLFIGSGVMWVSQNTGLSMKEVIYFGMFLLVFLSFCLLLYSIHKRKEYDKAQRVLEQERQKAEEKAQQDMIEKAVASALAKHEKQDDG